MQGPLPTQRAFYCASPPGKPLGAAAKRGERVNFWQKWRWVKWLRSIAAFLKPMQIPLHGAYTGFFLILSLFPLMVLLFALLGYTSLGLEEVVAIVQPLLPEALEPLVRSLLHSAYTGTSGTVLSVSAVTALWSASRGMHGLVQGLNGIYGTQNGGGFWRIRAVSMVYTLLFLVVAVLTLVLNMFGAGLLDYLRMTTDPMLLLLLELVDLRFVLLLLLQTGVFTLMYAWIPSRRNRIRDSFPGAVMAALGWLVYSRAFSAYVEHFPRYSNLFGSVYAVALGMLWLYFCISIVFYGGALNRWLKEH